MRISEEDHARIAAAVASAETTTSGEIRCVLAAGTENEAFSALMSAAIFAFILPPLAIYFLGIGPDTERYKEIARDLGGPVRQLERRPWRYGRRAR